MLNNLLVNGDIYNDNSGDYLTLLDFLELLKDMCKNQNKTSEGACFSWVVKIEAKGQWN